MTALATALTPTCTPTTLSPARRRRVVRNLIVSSVGVMTLSTVGGILTAGGAQAGAFYTELPPAVFAALLLAGVLAMAVVGLAT